MGLLDILKDMVDPTGRGGRSTSQNGQLDDIPNPWGPANTQPSTTNQPQYQQYPQQQQVPQQQTADPQMYYQQGYQAGYQKGFQDGYQQAFQQRQ